MARRIFPLICILMLLAGLPAADAAPKPAYSWGPYEMNAWRVTGLDPADPDPSFHYPVGIATAPSGDVYVTDTLNDAVLRFQADGTFVGQWGSAGAGAGQLNMPTGLAVADNGDVFVADTLNNRIQVFDPDGVLLGGWGTEGPGNGEFSRPIGLAFSPIGKLLVADTYNDRIQKFDPDGTYLTQFGESGDGDGRFNRPVGIAAGPNGRLYVTDNGNRTVQVFAADGTFLEDWNIGLNGPTGIATDDFGNVFVSDSYNDLVHILDADGHWVDWWGGAGTEVGRFDTPGGIATDAAGNVYVSDTYNKRVQVFEPCCRLLLYGPWSVERGRTFKMKGWLLSTVPECVADSTIRLFQRRTQIGTATTNSDGKYTFTYRTRERTWFKAVFDGKPHATGTCPPTETYPRWVYVHNRR